MLAAFCWNSGEVVETRDGRTDPWYNRLVIETAAWRVDREKVACNMFLSATVVHGAEEECRHGTCIGYCSGELPGNVQDVGMDKCRINDK